MEKIKVLHIGMGPNRGGLESFTFNIQKYIDRNLIKFDYINIWNKKIAYEDERIALESDILYMSPRKKNPIKSFEQLKKIIIEGNYDYVHYHCMHYNWFEPIYITCKMTQTKMIVHSHLTGFNRNTVKKEKILDAIGRHAVRNCNFYKLACGNEAGKWLFNDKEFEIITNGIEIDKFKFNEEKRKKVREKYNLKDGDIVIGHVGNFSYQKNYPKLIEIFKELHKINNNYKLMVVGNDEKVQAHELKEYIKKINLENDVIFTGLIDNSINIYSAFDLYVFPSFYEGLNISLIEAQCSGVQCFASNTLDEDTDVGGKYHIIDIESQSKDIAEYINVVLISDKYNREDIRINSEYSIEYSAKVLSDFYIKHLKD